MVSHNAYVLLWDIRGPLNLFLNSSMRYIGAAPVYSAHRALNIFRNVTAIAEFQVFSGWLGRHQGSPLAFPAVPMGAVSPSRTPDSVQCSKSCGLRRPPRIENQNVSPIVYHWLPSVWHHLNGRCADGSAVHNAPPPFPCLVRKHSWLLLHRHSWPSSTNQMAAVVLLTSHVWSISHRNLWRRDQKGPEYGIVFLNLWLPHSVCCHVHPRWLSQHSVHNGHVCLKCVQNVRSGLAAF